MKTSPKNLSDYVEPAMSSGAHLQFTAWILALLKASGELQHIDWTFILILLGMGLLCKLLSAAWRASADVVGPSEVKK